MTAASQQLREKRRAFASPGGSHDRLVRLLGNGLPAGVGVIVAVMLITPLFPKSEVSFLLDRNRVAITDQRLTVSNARYTGDDDKGRAFSVTAGSAVQQTAQVPVVEMRDLVAQMQLTDGPARIAAPSGAYHINSEKVEARGPVQVHTAGGYTMRTSDVSIDLKRRLALGEGGVSGQMPTGNFSADRISADLGERVLTLSGHARLHMVQGKLKPM